MTMSTIKKLVSEYDVTFAVKEWLLKHGWDVVAFNPPGSQGTFTIPNPAKDPAYRGQRDSESPDIIALKDKNTILIVEAKPQYNESDTEKLTGLVKNKPRMELLNELVKKMCDANDVALDLPVRVILAKAHGGEEHPRKDMATFIVSTKDKWDPASIDPSIDPVQFMEVELKAPNDEIKNLIEA